MSHRYKRKATKRGAELGEQRGSIGDITVTEKECGHRLRFETYIVRRLDEHTGKRIMQPRVTTTMEAPDCSICQGSVELTVKDTLAKLTNLLQHGIMPKRSGTPPPPM